jgi:hypothetical protein
LGFKYSRMDEVGWTEFEQFDQREDLMSSTWRLSELEKIVSGYMRKAREVEGIDMFPGCFFIEG